MAKDFEPRLSFGVGWFNDIVVIIKQVKELFSLEV